MTHYNEAQKSLHLNNHPNHQHFIHLNNHPNHQYFVLMNEMLMISLDDCLDE